MAENPNGKRDVSVTLKIVAGEFAGDLTVECQIEHIPALVAKLAAAGVRPAQSPYLWEQQPAGNTTPAAAPVPANVTAMPQTAPAPLAAPQPGYVPLCPVHGAPMKPSKHKPNSFYCTAKNPDGSYCNQST